MASNIKIQLVAKLLLAACLIGLVSCQDDELPQNYQWTNSAILPSFNAIHKFKIIDEDLYISGMVNGESGIYKLDHNNWVKLAATYDNANDFAFYKGVLYFGTDYGLYRLVSSTPEKLGINEAYIMAMDVYEDKLFISGSPLNEGETFGTVSYDGANLEVIDPYYSGYSMLFVGDKLFLANYPVAEIKATRLVYIDGLSGRSKMAVDQEGSIYVARAMNDGWGQSTSRIERYKDGNTSILGDSLPCFILCVQVYEGTVFVSGFSDPNTNVSYFLRNNAWIKLNEGAHDMIVYHNKLISDDGQVIALK